MIDDVQNKSKGDTNMNQEYIEDEDNSPKPKENKPIE